MIRTSALLIAVLAACSSASKPTTTAPTANANSTTTAQTAEAAAPVLQKGNGWEESSNPGEWVWLNDDGVSPVTSDLGVEPGGKGILVLDLPAGAKQADVAWLLASYVHPGSGTWSLHTQTIDNEPGGPAVASKDVDITAAMVGKLGDSPAYSRDTRVEFPPDATVTGRFYLVYTERAPRLTVGAQNAATHNVRYMPPGKTKSVAAPTKAMIRVGIKNIK